MSTLVCGYVEAVNVVFYAYITPMVENASALSATFKETSKKGDSRRLGGGYVWQLAASFLGTLTFAGVLALRLAISIAAAMTAPTTMGTT